MTPPLITDSVAHLQGMALRARSQGRRALVALAGLPGSGKSTAAQRWCEAVNAALGPGHMLALGMDGFHLTRAQLAAMTDPEAALRRRGSPWTFDAAAFRQRLLSLRQAQAPVDWPGFEHAVGDPVEGAVQVPPDLPLLLVEGLYLLHREHGWDLSGCFDAHWFLDVPMDTALDRLARRHMHAWGLTRDQALARIAVNDRLNAEIVEASRGRADAWVRA